MEDEEEGKDSPRFTQRNQQQQQQQQQQVGWEVLSIPNFPLASISSLTKERVLRERRQSSKKQVVTLSQLEQMVQSIREKERQQLQMLQKQKEEEEGREEEEKGEVVEEEEEEEEEEVELGGKSPSHTKRRKGGEEEEKKGIEKKKKRKEALKKKLLSTLSSVQKAFNNSPSSSLNNSSSSLSSSFSSSSLPSSPSANNNNRGEEGGEEDVEGGEEGAVSINPSSCPPLPFPPHQKLIEEVIGAVRELGNHFSSASSLSSQKLLADESKNNKIAQLVRGPLCSSLANLFCFGFKSDSYTLWLFGKNHFWNFVESCSTTPLPTSSGFDNSESELTVFSLSKSINEILEDEFLKEDDNRKFRALVCSALKFLSL